LHDIGGSLLGSLATVWTLRAISRVAELCCSTALAIDDAMFDISAIVPPISLMAATDSCVASCMPEMWDDISSVAFAVWPASDLTSERRRRTLDRPRRRGRIRSLHSTPADWSARQSP